VEKRLWSNGCCVGSGNGGTGSSPGICNHDTIDVTLGPGAECIHVLLADILSQVRVSISNGIRP